MTNVEIFYFALIVTTLLFNCVFSTVHEDSLTTNTTEKLIGKWYLVAVLDSDVKPKPLECITKTFSKTGNHEYLGTSEVKIVDGVATNEEWYINIRGKKMIRVLTFEETYPGPRENKFEIFDESGLLVEESATKSHAYRMYSHNATVNSEMVKFYEKKSHEEVLTMLYVNQDLCRERNKTQEIIDKGLKNKFLGSWHLIYRICPTGNVIARKNFFSHLHVNELTKENLEMEFFTKNTVSSKTFHAYAKIFFSKLYILDYEKNQLPIFELTFYEDFHQLLIKNRKYLGCDSIWSHQLDISLGSLRRYQTIAQNKNWTLIFNPL